MRLHELFTNTLQRFGAESPACERAWDEIAGAHGTKGRFYHTLAHLDHLVGVLAPCWHLLEDPDAMVLAIAYHDIVYRVTRSDNEEKSADLMRLRASQLGIPVHIIDRAFRHILATKTHQTTTDPDTSFLCDADLSVLGADPDTYDAYATGVRREYRRYPDLLYRPGRRKVLLHFLDMPRIYRTDAFHVLYEESARLNLTRELGKLGA